MDTIIDHIGVLLTRLQSPDFFEREEAVKELSTFNEDEAVAGLILALEDPDLGLRELAADYLIGIKGQTASQLLIQFLGHEDIGSRNLASEILVKIGNDAVSPLIAELENDDHDVRKFIVDILGLLEAKEAVEPLCQKLWDENSNVVCSAAEALGEIGDSKAVPHLVAAFEKVTDLQLQAVEALGKIGDPSALGKLSEFLDHDDTIIVYAVVEAIGRIGSKDSLKDIAPFLEHKERLLAEAAMTAVIRISQNNQGKIDYELKLEKFSDFLFEGVKNRNEEITEFTLTRLNHWYGNTVIQSLLDVIDYVDDTRLKQISNILSEIGPAAGKFIVEKLPSAPIGLKLKLLDLIKEFVDPEMGLALSKMADDPDPEVRMRVAHTLGVSGNPDCIGSLKKLAHDPTGHVRSAAYSAMGWLCGQSEAEFMFLGLDDKYPDVREAAMGALIIAGGSEVVAKLTKDLFHDDDERQRLAVTALGWIGEVETVPPLLQAINHPDAGVRRSAINSLARIGQVDNTEPIIMALNDENNSVRKAAVTALFTLKGEAAINDIRFLLDDQDVWVQYHAIASIGDLGQAHLADMIIPYLDHEQDIIKIATMKALAQMGADQAKPVLERMRSEKNQDVVAAAESALNQFGGKK